MIAEQGRRWNMWFKVAPQWCLLLLAVTGCASRIDIAYIPTPAIPSALDYYHALTTLSTEQLAVERAGLDQLNREQYSSVNQVKLAMLLAVESQDESEAEGMALAVLSQVISNGTFDQGQEDYLHFAHLWQLHLAQRIRFKQLQVDLEHSESERQAIAAQLTQLETRLELLVSLLASQERQNGLLEKQNSLLEHQIEALAAIEQQLVEREKKQPQ